MREFLLQHACKDPGVLSHAGTQGIGYIRKYGYGEFLDNFVDCDVTEIPGADNLFQAEGIIMEAQKKYSRLYQVAHSYLQINGTSGGLIASVLRIFRKRRGESTGAYIDRQHAHVVADGPAASLTGL